MKRGQNLTGKKFGRLHAIKVAWKDKAGTPFWKCKCRCGNTCVVIVYSLINKDTRSCGCLRKETSFKTGVSRRKHGLCGTPEYRAWREMRHRCSPAYRDKENYYNRGIKVCQEWIGSGEFEKFFTHVGLRPSPRHSLDRIDNNRGYGPGNVRWATYKEQKANQRKRLRIEQWSLAEFEAEADRRGYVLTRKDIMGKL